jgi:F-type H+-transporting ATPase subunit delta
MEKRFVARPYAKAIFDIAKETNTLEEWDSLLLALEDFSRNKDVVALYENPTIDNKELIDLLQTMLGDKATEEQKNFIKILIDNNRLKSLKTISKVFTTMLNEHMDIYDVDVTSSIELTSNMKSLLQEKLQKKLNVKQVRINSIIDKTIIGGLVIRMGDHVIDGSIKNKINQIKEHLLN